MPTTDLAHLSVQNLSHMGRVIVLDGCIDVGPSNGSSYYLNPVRISLRSECPEKDLDTIIDTLVARRALLHEKIKASRTPVTAKPTGPRKKHPKD